jgi:hypothetical protein
MSKTVNVDNIEKSRRKMYNFCQIVNDDTVASFSTKKPGEIPAF